MMFIDTHCHLDAQEFCALAPMERSQAAINNVVHCVVPAVEVANFEAVRAVAHAGGDSYCLGIHPLYVSRAQDDDLDRLDAALTQYKDDPCLVAVGEIGLDYFVPELCVSPLREHQEYFYLAQLRLARKHGLPVVLHSRRSADQVLKGLRAVGRKAKVAGATDIAFPQSWHGIAHAFNGSTQQAQAFIDLGLKLGFGGALTYERALQLRRLAAALPLAAIVLETDAPDMPPHWLYKTTEQRTAGEAQGVNSPAELPRIAAELAALRGISLEELAQATTRNALAALPKISALLPTLFNNSPISGQNS
ncbi:MAG: TatD family hydrolase [Rhodoferax sp.]|uniref:TatD family hydrolase n=1 Tax=Rhodoferax sp. TaxID=50421 RepID=UPI0026054346|nr:TatD family hydrolase [Rhodoferax sp.]MDD2881750.1 TatD family hydrolase [Rhodoferax sp.]